MLLNEDFRHKLFSLKEAAEQAAAQEGASAEKKEFASGIRWACEAYEEEDEEKFKEHILVARDIEPDNPSALTLYGVSLFWKGGKRWKTEEAISFFRKALDQNSQDRLAQWCLGQALQDRVNQRPQFSQSETMEGFQEIGQGDGFVALAPNMKYKYRIDGEEVDQSRFLDCHREFENHKFESLCYFNLAARAYATELELLSEYLEAVFIYDYPLNSDQRTQARSQAVDLMNELAFLNPGQPLYRLFCVQRDLESEHGNLIEAEEVLTRIIADHPRCVPAYGLLATLYHESGRKDKMAGILKECVRQSPESPFARILLGAVLSESGIESRDEAIQHLSAALVLPERDAWEEFGLLSNQTNVSVREEVRACLSNLFVKRGFQKAHERAGYSLPGPA